MSTDIVNTLLNFGGSKYPRRGDLKRAHRSVVILKGCEIGVEYFLDGEYMPATDTDPAFYPVPDIRFIEIGGQDVTRLVGDSALLEEITEAVEREMQR